MQSYYVHSAWQGVSLQWIVATIIIFFAEDFQSREFVVQFAAFL